MRQNPLFPHGNDAVQLYFPPESQISLLEITSMLCALQIFISFWCLSSSRFSALSLQWEHSQLQANVLATFNLCGDIKRYILCQNARPFIRLRGTIWVTAAVKGSLNFSSVGFD